MQENAITPGDNVIIIDDLIATGAFPLPPASPFTGDWPESFATDQPRLTGGRHSWLTNNGYISHRRISESRRSAGPSARRPDIGVHLHRRTGVLGWAGAVGCKSVLPRGSGRVSWGGTGWVSGRGRGRGRVGGSGRGIRRRNGRAVRRGSG